MPDRLFINHRFIQDDKCLEIESRFHCAVEVDEFGFYHLWFNRKRCLFSYDLREIEDYFNDHSIAVYSWDNSLRVVAKFKRNV